MTDQINDVLSALQARQETGVTGSYGAFTPGCYPNGRKTQLMACVEIEGCRNGISEKAAIAILSDLENFTAALRSALKHVETEGALEAEIQRREGMKKPAGKKKSTSRADAVREELLNS